MCVGGCFGECVGGCLVSVWVCVSGECVPSVCLCGCVGICVSE